MKLLEGVFNANWSALMLIHIHRATMDTGTNNPQDHPCAGAGSSLTSTARAGTGRNGNAASVTP